MRHTSLFLINTAICLFFSALALGDEEAKKVGASTDTALSFLADLSARLLGGNGPTKLDNNDGWQGVVFSAPGTSVSPLLTAYEILARDGRSISQQLENINVYDKVLLVRNGVGYLSTRTVSEVWEDILQRTTPEAGFVIQNLDDDVSKWLFAQADKVDLARGIKYNREPSTYVQKYREYEALSHILERAEQNQDESWRLHQRLAKYESIQEAKRNISDEWVKYGYLSEVTGANKEFEKSGATAWRHWGDALAQFQVNQRTLNEYTDLAETYLFPPPTVWLEMSNWMSVSSPTLKDGKSVAFQLAVVTISRPWFNIEALLNGELRLRSTAENGGYVVCDGQAPTLTDYPGGSLSVYPEKLVLVRMIRFPESGSDYSGHPLSWFAYPDAVNLLGYVVRILPEIRS